MAGVGQQHDLGLAAERLGVARRERRREVGVLLAPDDERRRVDLPQLVAGGGQRLRRGAAVELDHRPLGAVVEVVEHRAEVLLRQRADVDVAREAPDHALGHRAHRDLADRRPPPRARQAVPLVAGQEGQRVDDDQAGDALGEALGEGEADGAEVVDEQVRPLDAQHVEEALDEAGIAGDRVVEVVRLARPAEARQVGRDAAAEGEERRPLVGAVGRPVEIERRHAVRRGAAPEDGEPVELGPLAVVVSRQAVELGVVFLDGGHPSREDSEHEFAPVEAADPRPRPPRARPPAPALRRSRAPRPTSGRSTS